MPKNNLRSSSKRASEASSSPVDGKSIHNQILLSLPSAALSAVWAQLELVEMRNRDILNEIGEPITNCYFVNAGLASVLMVMNDGKSVEVGLSGSEGFVGLPLVVGLKTSSTRVVVQVAGAAFRIEAASLLKLVAKWPALEKALNRYSQEFGAQTAQVAACNRLHNVGQRMARWLLMSQDRVGGDSVPLTQEFLAHMLGTRRASVTVAAGILQENGSIHYARGGVEVLNRKKLEAHACECYRSIALQRELWRTETV